MKTGSKIALALGAVAAFLFAKKKQAVSGIGKTEYNPLYGEIVIIPTNKKREALRINRNRLGDIDVWLVRKEKTVFGNYTWVPSYLIDTYNGNSVNFVKKAIIEKIAPMLGMEISKLDIENIEASYLVNVGFQRDI